MENEFIPYIEALALKELGFDEPCFNLYDFRTKQLMYKIPNIGEVAMFKCDNHNKTNHISAPTFSQAFKWFREKYNIIPNIHSIYTDETYTKIQFWFWFANYEDDSDDEVFYGTYEEAELECLKKLIEIIQTKKLWKKH